MNNRNEDATQKRRQKHPSTLHQNKQLAKTVHAVQSSANFMCFPLLESISSLPSINTIILLDELEQTNHIHISSLLFYRISLMEAILIYISLFSFAFAGTDRIGWAERWTGKLQRSPIPIYFSLYINVVPNAVIECVSRSTSTRASNDAMSAFRLPVAFIGDKWFLSPKNKLFALSPSQRHTHSHKIQFRATRLPICRARAIVSSIFISSIGSISNRCWLTEKDESESISILTFHLKMIPCMVENSLAFTDFHPFSVFYSWRKMQRPQSTHTRIHDIRNTTRQRLGYAAGAGSPTEITSWHFLFQLDHKNRITYKYLYRMWVMRVMCVCVDRLLSIYPLLHYTHEMNKFDTYSISSHSHSIYCSQTWLRRPIG